MAVPRSHPLASRASVRLVELDGQSFIDRVNGEFVARECELLEAANVRSKGVDRAGHEGWAISWVEAGLGIGIMSRWRGLENVVYLPIVDLEFERTVGLKWREPAASEIVERFCRFSAGHRWEVD